MSAQFQYTPLTADLVELSSELAAVGGGDTRIGHLETYCRVHASPAHHPPPYAYIDDDTRSVVVRDPRCGPDVPSNKAHRKYRVSGGMDQTCSQEEVYDMFGEPSLSWLWDGFNSNIVSYGQTGTGKTYTLYGQGGLEGPETTGLVTRVLEGLYDRINASEHGRFLTVGVSMWELMGNHLVDLLKDQETDDKQRSLVKDGQFVTVNCPSSSSIHEVMRIGRLRSVNWSDEEYPRPLPNRAHSFLRVVLYDTRQRRVSSLHVVDLVGTHTLQTQRMSVHKPTGASNKPGTAEYEKKQCRQQLLVLSRIISELASHHNSSSASTGEPPRVLSARESRLTQLLTPLLAGNAKTFFLGTLSPEQDCHLDTVYTLRVCSRAMAISCPCMRTMNVDEAELCFTSIDDALPNEVLAAAAPSVSTTTKPVSYSDIYAQKRDELKKKLGLSEILDAPSATKRRPVLPNDVEAVHPPVLSPTVSAEEPKREHAWQAQTHSANVSPIHADDSFSEWRARLERRLDRMGQNTLDTSLPQSRARTARSPKEAPTGGSPVTAQAIMNHNDFDTWKNNLRSRLHLDETTITVDGPSSPDRAKRLRERLGLLETNDSYADLGVRSPARMNEKKSSPAGRSPGPKSALGKKEEKLRASPQLQAAREDLSASVHAVAAMAEKVIDTVHREREALSPDGGPMPEHVEVFEKKGFPGGWGADGEILGREYQDMKRTVASTAEMLHREEGVSDKLRHQIEKLKADAMETATAYEVSIDSLKVENINLRARIRKLTKQSPYPEAFATYEHDIERLQSELEVLRGQNQFLQGQYRAALQGDQTKPRTGVAMKTYRNQLQDAQRELEKLRAENKELQRKSRGTDLSRRMLEDAQKKVNKLSRQLSAREEEAAALRKTKGELESQLATYHSENEGLREEGHARKYQVEQHEREIQSLKASLHKAHLETNRERMVPVGVPGRPKAPAHTRTMDILRQLEREVHSNPRCVKLIRQLKAENEHYEEYFEAMQTREDSLLGTLMDLEARNRRLHHRAEGHQDDVVEMTAALERKRNRQPIRLDDSLDVSPIKKAAGSPTQKWI